MTYHTTIEFPHEALEYLVIWHSFLDACPKCQNLTTYPFVYKDYLPSALWHPQWKDVWDLINDHSLAHPNCRCAIEVYVRIDWSKIPEFAELTTRLDMPPLQWEEMLDVTRVAELTGKVDSLRAETVRATGSLREMEYILYRTTSILSRMGLPPEVDAAITRMQHLILTVRMLHSALVFLESATPYGLIMGGITLVGAGIAVSSVMARDQMEMRRPQY